MHMCSCYSLFFGKMKRDVQRAFTGLDTGVWLKLLCCVVVFLAGWIIPSGYTLTAAPIPVGDFNTAPHFSMPDPGLQDDSGVPSSSILANDAPVVVNPINDRRLKVGEPPYTVDLNNVFEDPDNDGDDDDDDEDDDDNRGRGNQRDDVLSFRARSSDESTASTSIEESVLSVTPVSSGSSDITVWASDGKKESDGHTFEVTVTEDALANADPIVSQAINDTSLKVGNPPFQINLNSVFSDPDGDPLTFKASSNEPLVARVNISGSTLTVTLGIPGEATITVTAEDGNGGSVQDQFAVKVALLNLDPVVSRPIGNRSMYEDDGPLEIDLKTVFSDPEGDNLTLSAQSSDNSIATTTVTSTDILRLTPQKIGETEITVTANDGKGGSVQDKFTLTVTQRPNRDPVVQNEIQNVELLSNSPSLKINLQTVFSDPDSDTLSFSAESTDPSVATASVSGNSLSVQPVAKGQTTITVTAEDGKGGSVSEDFMVTVNEPPNEPPVVQNPIDDLSLLMDGPDVTINLNNVFSDPNRDALTYEATSSDPSVATADISDNTLRIRPVKAGNTDIEVIARDVKEASATVEFSVSVAAVKAAVSTSNASNVDHQSATLNGTINPKGIGTTYYFEYGTNTQYGQKTNTRNAGSGEDLVDVSEEVTDLNPETTYHFRLVARNDHGQTTHGRDLTFKTSARPNRSPEVVDPIADRSITVGDPAYAIDLTTVFSDPDEDPLTFQAPHVSNNDIVEVTLEDDVLRVSPLAVGQATITITARDDQGATVQDQFVITVNAIPNENPVVQNAIRDQQLTVQGAPYTHNLNSVFSDPDDDPLTFSVETNPSSIVTINLSDGDLTVRPDAIGEVLITITADDGKGGTAQDHFTVIVNERPNKNPEVVQNIEDFSIDEGGSPVEIDLETIFSDPDGDPLEYELSSDAPDVASASISGSSLIVSPGSPGRAVITVTALDGKGGQVEQEFAVDVASVEIVIEESDIPDEPEVGSEVTIRARIEQVARNARVTLYYRQGGEASFSSRDMVPSGGVYEAAIPSNAVSSRGVQWYIRAEIRSESMAESNRFDLRVAHSGVDLQQPAGSEQTAYRLISFPLELSNEQATAVLEDDLGPYDDTSWRFFSHQGNDQFREGPANVSITPGEAYWLIVRDGASISTGEGLSVPLEDFSIDLDAGCNFVGNPFHFDLAPDQVALESGDAVKLWAYPGQWAQHTAAWKPMEGYVLCVPESDRLILSPFPKASASKHATLASATQSLDWSIQVRAQSQQAIDASNRAGVASTASDGLDDLDWPEPPVIGEYVSVYFVSNGQTGFPGGLSTDIRPAEQDGNVWNIEVRSNIQDRIDLLFDGLDQVPSDLEVWLVDEALQVRQNLRENKVYSFAGTGEPAPRRLKLIVGKPGFTGMPEEIEPQSFSVEQNHPNPFGTLTTIRYQIPEPSQVTVTVFDMLGKRIATLVDGDRMAAGHHTVTWDGKDQSGTPVANGAYVYHIQTEKTGASRVMTYIR